MRFTGRARDDPHRGRGARPTIGNVMSHIAAAGGVVSILRGLAPSTRRGFGSQWRLAPAARA
jgi:hypothetical protein